MLKRTFAIAMLALGAAATTSAQDINGEPYSATVNLTGGFTPDPYVVNVTSGGSINAENQVSGCRGFISNRPDVRLNFSAGSLPLILSVDSTADTTLIINAPDGQWYCDDDGGAGLNPAVRFDNAMTGRYEIWIGTYDGAQDYNGATLYISELSSQ